MKKDKKHDIKDRGWGAGNDENHLYSNISSGFLQQEASIVLPQVMTPGAFSPIA